MGKDINSKFFSFKTKNSAESINFRIFLPSIVQTDSSTITTSINHQNQFDFMNRSKNVHLRSAFGPSISKVSLKQREQNHDRINIRLTSATTIKDKSRTSTTTNTTSESELSFNSSTNDSGKNKDNQNSKPRFVTTVPRGQFLSANKTYFTFSSHPRPIISKSDTVTNNTAKNTTKRQKNYRKNCPSEVADRKYKEPRGVHDYYNVMWDPHVYRGSTTAKSDADSRIPRNVDALATGADSKVPPQPPEQSPGDNAGHFQDSTIHFRKKRNPNSRIRFISPGKKISSAPLPYSSNVNGGNHHYYVQTDQYLEELNNEIEIEESDAIVQTEPWLETRSLPALNEPGNDHSSRNFHSMMLPSGVDASTQIQPGELTNFDEDIQPMLDSLVTKILEQSLMEVMEEEELSALREQKNTFLERRLEEELELRKLQEEQKKIQAQKELLKKRLEKEKRSVETSSKKGSKSSMSEDPERLIKIGGTQYTSAYLLELLPSVLNNLAAEGFICGQVEDDEEQMGDDEVFSPFVPWIDSSNCRVEDNDEFVQETDLSNEVNKNDDPSVVEEKDQNQDVEPPH